MTPEETATVARPEAEAEVPTAEAVLEAEDEAEAEEDFNPLGHIEGWSAFECSSGPFGHRG
jgi:hypothetical protein